MAAVQEIASLPTVSGTPEPLGPSIPTDGSPGVNFSVFSKRASRVLLCVYLDSAVDTPSAELPMQRSGDHWHLQLPTLPRSGVRYGFRVFGDGGWDQGDRWDPKRVLIDPLTRQPRPNKQTGRDTFGDKAGTRPWLSSFDLAAPPFDWQGVQPPGRSMEKTVIYEMSVRHFTADPSSGLAPQLRGTYAGLAARIPHLLALGITAVELLPIFEYDEMELQRLPNPRQHMTNAWGYSTISFFAPMARFGTQGAGAAAASAELKACVRELHRAGIEVLLDVVYNHTAEGDDTEPYSTSLRCLDCQEYYLLDRSSGKAQFRNYSGCGNSLNANHGAAKRLVLDSLRHWVNEYHIDGFRFDLASALTRGSDGAPLTAPPLIREMSSDPVLGRVKLIAEPWDCGGLYQVGSFPNWDRWAEWNGRYRDDVRRFIKGDAGAKPSFATRLAGSADLYAVNKRKPSDSINFVVAHDGFTLADLVSFNQKRNQANGEGGRDGCNDNDSWNCGVEGHTADEGVNALRARQMRNFHVALMLSQGTPMVLMGDEYGHSKGGNNNTYGIDGPISWFQWGGSGLEGAADGFFRFYAGLMHFRQRHPLLGRATFMSPSDITWHESNWSNSESRYLAFTLHSRGGSGAGSLFVAFNAHSFAIDPVPVPTPPKGFHWSRVVRSPLDSTSPPLPSVALRRRLPPR